VNDCAVAGWSVISASNDKTLMVWDLRTRKNIATLKGHKEWVTACAITSDGSTAASVSINGPMIVWNLKSDKAIMKVPMINTGFSNVSGCAVTPDDSTIVTISSGKSVTLWKSYFAKHF